MTHVKRKSIGFVPPPPPPGHSPALPIPLEPGYVYSLRPGWQLAYSTITVIEDLGGIRALPALVLFPAGTVSTYFNCLQPGDTIFVQGAKDISGISVPFGVTRLDASSGSPVYLFFDHMCGTPVPVEAFERWEVETEEPEEEEKQK